MEDEEEERAAASGCVKRKCVEKSVEGRDLFQLV